MRHKLWSALIALLLTGCDRAKQVSTSAPTSSPDRKQGYSKTDGFPLLHIKSVEVPENRTQPLKLVLEFTCDGQTPVAVAQEQFSVHIFTDKEPYKFVGEAIFPANTPRIFVATPEKPLILGISTNKNGTHELLSDMPPGIYKIQVYINSGKTLEFDYQWLGQTYSDERRVVLN